MWPWSSTCLNSHFASHVFFFFTLPYLEMMSIFFVKGERGINPRFTNSYLLLGKNVKVFSRSLETNREYHMVFFNFIDKLLYKYNYKYTTITINYINTTSCYKFTWVNPEKMLVHIYYQKASNGFVPLLDYSLNRLKPLSFYGGNLFTVTWGRQVAHPFPQISLTVCSIFIIFYKDVYQKPNSQTVVRKNLWLSYLSPCWY